MSSKCQPSVWFMKLVLNILVVSWYFVNNTFECISLLKTFIIQPKFDWNLSVRVQMTKKIFIGSSNGLPLNLKGNIKALHHWPFAKGTTGGFPSQRASNAEGVFISWLHYDSINPLRAKFFRGNITIHLYSVSFLHIDMTQVLKIVP